MEEDLNELHDPGLTPGGIKDSKLFTTLYTNLRAPSVVVTSPLRRCLQTTIYAFGELIDTGKVRAIAHPDLQEVSNAPCDTGTPLDTLREEFRQIQFPDELFPDIWPRDPSTRLEKEGTIYDDTPDMLQDRAERIRKWLREELDDTEIIVVTHGSFAHFFFDNWDGEPGDSLSYGTQLANGQARPMALPDKSLPDDGFQPCGTWIHIGPDYPEDGISEDYSPEVYLKGQRDCGVFTSSSLQ